MRLIRHYIPIIFGLFLLWWLVIFITKLPPFILPDPFSVLIAVYQNAPMLSQHAIYTLSETLLGLFGAIILGFFSAVAISLSTRLQRWLHPVLIISQTLPTFVIAPLFVIWFGYGISSKVATTILMLYFPITSTFYDGLVNCPNVWLSLASTMTQSKWKVLWRIRLPAAMPQFASGIRIATVIAPIGAVVGEWVGASHGLGFLMLNANARLQIPLLFAALLWVMTLSLILFATVNGLIKYMIPWTYTDTK